MEGFQINWGQHINPLHLFIAAGCRTSHSEDVWGVETTIKEGENNHYFGPLYATAENDNMDVYVDINSQNIIRCNSEHSEGGNLGAYLEQQGYLKNLNLFVFNYPNEDPVIYDARKFQKYVENLINHVRTSGTDEMKACFYDSPEDYDDNRYKINIVGHSMGGLVARYYIENLGHDNNVDKLITICTPHWGSGYADASCISGMFHKICDHDLRFESAMYGGSFTTELDCTALGFKCTNEPYGLTDELNYLENRTTKYYAIAGIDYDAAAMSDNNYGIELNESFLTYTELSNYIHTQSSNSLYKVFMTGNRVEHTYMDINDVGDNMVGFLSQIGWTEKEDGDYPVKKISFENVFVIIDTNGGNAEAVNTLHNKIPHRNKAMEKVYKYLNS